MMIRGLLFLLFLYTLLVWVVAFYLGDDVRDRGLFWTAVGVAALLVWLIFERAFGWWRLRQARNAAKPVGAAPTSAAKAAHPDDTAFRQLVDEANLRLAQAESMAGSGATIFDLPLFLVVGAEGAGKTSVIQHSGIEPHLLAGQATSGGAAAMPTRTANIWLAKNTVYLEMSGRIFGGDLARFSEWLQELAPRAQLSALEARLAKTKLGRLMQPTQRPGNLRGVILVSDLREFIGTPEMSKLDRAAGLVRERLDAISAHFGVACPVYLLFSRTDQITYFREFFARMSETEAAQVFGTLTASDETHGADQVWAEAESRRLNRYFNQIFLRLADRRLSALTTEAQMHLRPAIYEFPREFKRVRTGMVQYLVDIFRPNPLKAAPQLRGFFFTGTRLVERGAAAGPRGGDAHATPRGMEATQFFKPGATEIFGHGAAAAGGGAAAGPMIPGWMFLSELFHKVFPRDRVALAPVAQPRSNAPGWSKMAVAAAGTAAALGVLVWTVSWFDNRRWIADATEQIERMNRQPNQLTVASLQPVDELRRTLERIEGNDTWRPTWGLYSGDEVLRLGQQAYFKRIKDLFLENANVNLVASFAQPGEALKATSLYDRVKTHVTVTAKACAVNEPLVRNVLQQAVMEAHPNLEGTSSGLVRSQLAYYAKILRMEEGMPVRLASSPSLSTVQASLRNAGGVETQLSGFLSQAGKDNPAVRVVERVPDYAKALAGLPEVEGQFTKAAAQQMEALIDGAKSSGGEECVTGAGAGMLASITSDTKKQLTQMYYLRYAAAWRAFLKSYQVLRFNSRQDAAVKLDLLSRPQSPLLMLVKMVAENTDFPEKAGEKSSWDAAADTAKTLGLSSVTSALDRLKKGQKKAEAIEKLVAGPPGLTAHDVTRLFQPVHVTTPPKSDVLKSEANGAYIDGLRGLQKALDSMSRASEADMVALIPQGQEALAAAKAGLRSLADRFADTGNQGLNLELEALLEQPIRLADAVLPHNQVIFSAGKINGDLAAMCKAISPVMSKYPFNPLSSVGAEISEVSRVFGPVTGAVWQFQMGSLPEMVVKEGSNWMAAKPKPRLRQELLTFLTRGQQLADAFYPSGKVGAPQLAYSLRRVSDKPGLTIRIDGTEMDTAASAIQKAFAWPGSAAGVDARIGGADLNTGFASYSGRWAVFQFFQYADDRPLFEKAVQWSATRGPGGARLQTISPPARLEFVNFPNGVDLFNPRFFEGLKCPSQAVIPE